MALTIIAVVSASTLEHLARVSEFGRRATRREDTVESADRLLRAMSLLTRSEMADRTGRRVYGNLVVDVWSRGEGLFEVAVRQRGDVGALLATLVFIPSTATE